MSNPSTSLISDASGSRRKLRVVTRRIRYAVNYPSGTMMAGKWQGEAFVEPVVAGSSLSNRSGSEILGETYSDASICPALCSSNCCSWRHDVGLMDHWRSHGKWSGYSQLHGQGACVDSRTSTVDRRDRDDVRGLRNFLFPPAFGRSKLPKELLSANRTFRFSPAGWHLFRFNPEIAYGWGGRCEFCGDHVACWNSVGPDRHCCLAGESDPGCTAAFRRIVNVS